MTRSLCSRSIAASHRKKQREGETPRRAATHVWEWNESVSSVRTRSRCAQRIRPSSPPNYDVEPVLDAGMKIRRKWKRDVRKNRFADTVARKYGLPLALAAKTTDVPAQSRSLATGLAQGGVKFMHIGCNSACTFPAYPPLFWWEGPDGSRVLTMYSGSYGTCDALYPHDWLCAKDPSKDGCLGHNLLPPPGWPHKTWVAIIVTADNSGPPKMDEVKALFTDVAQKLPGVKVRMGTMEEFADAIIAEHPDLPVVRNEMPDTWIHGCMCDPGGMKIARHVCTLLPAVELLNTQLCLWGVPVANPAKDIASAYEQSLLYCEHTWGGAEAVSVYGDAFPEVAAGQVQEPRRLLGRQDRLHPHRREHRALAAGRQSRRVGQGGGSSRAARRRIQPAPMAAQRHRRDRRTAIGGRPRPGLRLQDLSGARGVPAHASPRRFDRERLLHGETRSGPGHDRLAGGPA